MDKPFIAIRIDTNSGRLLEYREYPDYSSAYTQVWSENYANMQVGYSPEWGVFVEATEELVEVGGITRSYGLWQDLKEARWNSI